ncbi:hypothetical protein, partial [Roseibacillus persicicus]|uniref:hypothetical protein n=1 Tax=Roseibacillus persicicus TaxID=454148 RepID=UPI001E337E84
NVRLKMSRCRLITYLILSAMLLLGLIFAEEEAKEQLALEATDFGSSEEIAAYASKGKVSNNITDWLRGISYVELVLYDHTMDSGAPLVKDGKLHKGLKKEWTKRLSKEEVQKITRALTGEHKWQGGALCYEPHHGFVFYDGKGIILGHVEICFMCGNYYSYPKDGLSQYWDLEALKNIVSGHELPLFNTPREWERFYAEP